jgi:RNAse (barnase) inhibitor barstar
MKEYTIEEVSNMILDMAKSQAEKTTMDEAKYKTLLMRSAVPTRIMWRKFDEKVNFVEALVERAVEILEREKRALEGEEDELFFRTNDRGVMEDGWYDHQRFVNESLKECKEYLDEVKA